MLGLRRTKSYLLADGYAAYGKAASFVVRFSFSGCPAFFYPAARPGFGREFVQGRFLWVMLAILKYNFKFAM